MKEYNTEVKKNTRSKKQIIFIEQTLSLVMLLAKSFSIIDSIVAFELVRAEDLLYIK